MKTNVDTNTILISEDYRRNILAQTKKEDIVYKLGDLTDRVYKLELCKGSQRSYILCPICTAVAGQCLRLQNLLCIASEKVFGFWETSTDERQIKQIYQYSAESVFYDFIPYRQWLIIIFETEVLILDLDRQIVWQRSFDIITNYSVVGSQLQIEDMSDQVFIFNINRFYDDKSSGWVTTYPKDKGTVSATLPDEKATKDQAQHKSALKSNDERGGSSK